MNSTAPSRSPRAFPWAFGVAAATAAVVLGRAVLLEYEHAIRGFSPGCYFHRLTGLHCPGCGGTRAFFALIKGDVAAVWRMNPLLPVALAAAGFLGLAVVAVRLKTGVFRLPEWLKISATTGWCAVGVIVAFWILRNLPWWPFTLLAPH